MEDVGMADISTGTINHFSLTVTDRNRARDFYTDVLGFEFVAEFGPKYMFSNGQVILGIAEAPIPDAPFRVISLMRTGSDWTTSALVWEAGMNWKMLRESSTGVVFPMERSKTWGIWASW
jgi:predicted enzyme related to lactoylglutathione lyase